MVKHNFFANSFFAISQDVESGKEYIIYCVGEADQFFDGYPTKTVVYKERQLGEFISDFTTSMNEYEHSSERGNLLLEYIEELLFRINHFRICYSGSDDQEEMQRMNKIISNINRKIISDDFFELQRHLPCYGAENNNSNDIVKQMFSDMPLDEYKIRIKVIDGRNYFITDYYFNCLLVSVLNQLYSMNLYPRTCFRCGKLFLAKNNHTKVLCSEECKKQNNVEKTMRYYKNRGEVEKLYHKIYDKWKTRIRKCEKNGLICNEGVAELKEKITELTKNNRVMANERKKGNVPYKNGQPDYVSHEEHHKIFLKDCDNELYRIYLKYKRK